MFVQSFLLSLVLVSTVISVGFASAAFLEDYSDTPTKKGLNTILDYCSSHPNGNITNDLVSTENISEFYTGYTCDKAAQDNLFLAGNSSMTNTTITILH